MKKDKIKDKILPNGKLRYLSAQDYKLFLAKDKQFLKEILFEAGFDPDEYLKDMTALFPKKFEPKPLVWRNR